MCPDDDVDFTIFQFFDNLFLLTNTSKPAHHINVHRVIAKTLTEGREMLLCQNRCGDKYRYLFFIENHFERSTHSHLGLTVSHIATNQPIHGLLLLQILYRLVDSF